VNRLSAVRAGFVGLAVAGLLVGCATESVQQKAQRQAADLARTDIGQLAEQMRRSLMASAQTGADAEHARADASKAAGSGVFNVIVMRSSVAGQNVEVDLAVSQVNTATDGFSTATEVVRICARLTGHVAPETATMISNLSCPADLAPAVEGAGGVSATASYRA
jgi:hypothetical protein